MTRTQLSLITLLVIAAAGGGAVWYINRDIEVTETGNVSEERQSQEENTNTLPKWPEESYTEDDYTGWSIYTSNENSYILQYPADWIISDFSDNSIGHTISIQSSSSTPFVSYFDIGVIDITEQNYLQKTLNGYRNMPDVKEKEVYFANKKSHLFSSKDQGYDIVFSHNNKIFTIATDRANTDKVNLIFRSFRLID